MVACKNCVYYRPIEGEDGWGSCRKNPPKIINPLVKYFMEEDNPSLIGYWPEISDYDWCGEYLTETMAEMRSFEAALRAEARLRQP